MHSLGIGLGVGLVAGILDAVPMILRRMPARPTASALVQWLVVGLVITYLSTGLPSWANGLIAGVLCAVPIVILISGTEPASVPIVLITSAVLGTLAGFAVGYLR